MELNEILGLLSRWAHILAAATMIGGTFFMRFSYVPAKLAYAPSDEFSESVRKGWARLVMMCTLFLLISGLYNAAMKAMGFHLDMVYNGLLLVKILLAFAAFYFSARLSGRSEGAVKFREREKHWLNILCIIMLAIVLMAGYMKIGSVGFEPKIRGEKSEVPAVSESISPKAGTTVKANA
jgi:uncharacterized membrane protein